MAKAVSGFQITDGRFFEEKEEAEYEEAKTNLIKSLTGLELSEDLIDTIIMLGDDILDFLEAREAYVPKKPLPISNKKKPT